MQKNKKTRFIVHRHVSGYGIDDPDFDSFVEVKDYEAAKKTLNSHFSKKGNPDLVGGGIFKIKGGKVYEIVGYETEYNEEGRLEYTDPKWDIAKRWNPVKDKFEKITLETMKEWLNK